MDEPEYENGDVCGRHRKALGRMFTSEFVFRNIYTAQNRPGMIAFASSFPGSIIAVEITPETPVIAQKSAFLASTDGVELSMYLQKKIGTAVFGGEGIFNTLVTGPGRVTLQTMPLSNLIGTIAMHFPSSKN